MFDDFDGVCRRSWNSAGKVAIKTPLCGRSIKSAKILETPIFQDDERSQKEGAGWATMGPDHAQARAPGWPRLGVVWPPWPTSSDALTRISSPRKPKTRGATRNIFCRRCEAENTRERKALRQREICRGDSFPEGGNRRHRHRHRAGLHWDHYHHHLHHRHRHLHRCTSSPL